MKQGECFALLSLSLSLSLSQVGIEGKKLIDRNSASNFEHSNFASNGSYCKRKFDNSNYCALLVIFQSFKIAFQAVSIHPLV
jgi:hypothetical protein